jgi:hypothetical protein
MKKAFEKYSTAMSYDEFVNIIIEKLKSSENLSQSELFDLLGYENIEFIEYIIEHRKLILAWYSNKKLTKIFTGNLMLKISLNIIQIVIIYIELK